MLTSLLFNDFPQICECDFPRQVFVDFFSLLLTMIWTSCELVLMFHVYLDPMILGSADGTNNGWSLQNDLFTPVNSSYTPVYVAGIMADLTLKRNAGFPVSFG